MIDVRDDGSIEATGLIWSPQFGYGGELIIPSVPTNIRVTLQNECGESVSTVQEFNPPSGSGGRRPDFDIYDNNPSAICRGLPVGVYLDVRREGFLLPYLTRVEWSWNGVDWRASSGLDTVVIIPSTSPPWILRCRYTLSNNAPGCIGRTHLIQRTLNPRYDVIPTLAGSVCNQTGGTVRVFIRPEDRPGADSVHYFLPMNEFVSASRNDTVTISVPAGNANYLGLYYRIYGCSNATDHRLLRIPIAYDAPKFTGLNYPERTCAGTQLFPNYRLSTAPVDSLVATLGNNRVAIMYPPESYYFVINVPSTPGTYTLRAIAYNCVGSDTIQREVEVVEGASARFTIATQPACAGQPVRFERLGSNQGVYQVNWDFGDRSPLKYDTSLTITHTFTQPGTYEVTLRVEGRECGATFYTERVTVLPAPVLRNLNITTSGNTISYSVEAQNYDQIIWDFGDGNTRRGALSGSHTYAESGGYTVRVTIQSPCGTLTLSETIVITHLGHEELGGWRVYPNPTWGEVVVDGGSHRGRAVVQVMDLMGRMVGRYEVDKQPARLRLNMPAGMYMLQILTEKGMHTTRLVIE